MWVAFNNFFGSLFKEILEIKNSFSLEDANKDRINGMNLKKKALMEAYSKHNYYKTVARFSKIKRVNRRLY